MADLNSNAVQVKAVRVSRSKEMKRERNYPDSLPWVAELGDRDVHKSFFLQIQIRSQVFELESKTSLKSLMVVMCVLLCCIPSGLLRTLHRYR